MLFRSNPRTIPRRKDMPGQVILMEPLHNKDDGTCAGVVKTGGQRVIKPIHRALAHDFALHLHGIVRIVNDDNATAFTR